MLQLKVDELEKVCKIQKGEFDKKLEDFLSQVTEQKATNVKQQAEYEELL